MNTQMSIFNINADNSKTVLIASKIKYCSLPHNKSLLTVKLDFIICEMLNKIYSIRKIKNCFYVSLLFTFLNDLLTKKAIHLRTYAKFLNYRG